MHTMLEEKRAGTEGEGRWQKSFSTIAPLHAAMRCSPQHCKRRSATKSYGFCSSWNGQSVGPSQYNTGAELALFCLSIIQQRSTSSVTDRKHSNPVCDVVPFLRNYPGSWRRDGCGEEWRAVGVAGKQITDPRTLPLRCLRSLVTSTHDTIAFFPREKRGGHGCSSEGRCACMVPDPPWFGHSTCHGLSRDYLSQAQESTPPSEMRADRQAMLVEDSRPQGGLLYIHPPTQPTFPEVNPSTTHPNQLTHTRR